MMAHPDSKREPQAPFEAHENCYDCADFYDSCKGWGASRDFQCGDFNRLPGILPGTCGQAFPPSRMNSCTEPRSRPVAGSPVRVGAQPEARRCGCGAPLAKGRRLCDGCRVEARRQTKRQYMRTYMRQRRSGVIGSDPGMPFPAQSTHVAGGGGEDRPVTGHPIGVPRCEQTSVLTGGVPQISGFLR